MPKAQPLTPEKVIDYFKSSNLETASLVLRLATSEVRARQNRSTEAKAAQKKGKASKPNAAPAASQETSDPSAGESAVN